jgi:hypothetical protein
MANLDRVYVLQDGASFYLFDTQETPRSVVSIMTWDGAVKDGDIKSAQEARDWFLNVAAPYCGFDPIMER